MKMKFLGIVLLCCALLVKGQTTSPAGEDTTTTTPSTTKAPETTTREPTTTTKEPSTTTAKPSPPAPTPSPSPTPVVPDYPKNGGKWSVEDGDNTCIVLKGAMQITILNENKTEIINVPPSPLTAATGDCSGPQTIVLAWNSTNAGKLNRLSLTFESNNATKGNSVDASSGITVGKYGLQDVQTTLYLNSSRPIEANLTGIAKFQTPLNHSYSCLAEEVIKSGNGNFTLKISEVQLEAYRFTPPGHHEFSAAVQCPADDATDVVPIAVGAALAGLVVIVLIAYLIGRKRSRARGYQSV